MEMSFPPALPPEPAPRPEGPARWSPWALIRFAGLAAFVTLGMLTAWRGVYSAVDSTDFPEELAVKLDLMPVLFPLHMVTGSAALVLVPLAWALRRRPAWHRRAGRVAAAAVVIAGLTAFPVALGAPVTHGSAAGFAAQGAVWLALLALGIRAIRWGDVARHRACMTMMAAVTSGAIWFRVWLAIWAMVAQGRFYTLFYACDAWFGWVAPLAVTIVALKQGDRRRPKADNARPA